MELSKFYKDILSVQLNKIERFKFQVVLFFLFQGPKTVAADVHIQRLMSSECLLILQEWSKVVLNYPTSGVQFALA